MGWQLCCFVRLNPYLWLSQRVPRAELDRLRGSWWNCLDFDARPRSPLAPFRRGAGFYGGDDDGPTCLCEVSSRTRGDRRVSALGLTYVAGILSSTSVWAPGSEPLPPKRWSGRGRPPTRPRRSARHKPVSVRQLALSLPERAWRTVGWREGTRDRLTSRFARLRVRAAHRNQLHGEEWLLIEWPEGEKEPTKYWFSTLPHDIAFKPLVDLAKLRWRIERDYQELKQELGLGHFEGRSWRGFHHHATLCIAAYGFLISERETIPPSAPRAAARLTQLALPADYRPRGAADPNRASHA